MTGAQLVRLDRTNRDLGGCPGRAQAAVRQHQAVITATAEAGVGLVVNTSAPKADTSHVILVQDRAQASEQGPDVRGVDQASSRQPAASLARAYPAASCVLPHPAFR